MPSGLEILNKRRKPRVSGLSILQRSTPIGLEPIDRRPIGGDIVPTPERSFANPPPLTEIIGRELPKILSGAKRAARSIGGLIASGARPGLPIDPVVLEEFNRFRTEIATTGRFAEESAIEANKELDRFFGVVPDPFREDRPLTPDEDRFKRIGEVPVVGPALQIGGQVARTGGRFASGVAGFVGSLPRFLDLQPGQAGEEVQGVRDLVGSVLPTADFLTQKAFGVEDPSASVDPESLFSRLQQGITGRPFTQEEFRKTISSVAGAPETPLFGAALAAGGIKGAKGAEVLAKRGFERVSRKPVQPAVEEVRASLRHRQIISNVIERNANAYALGDKSLEVALERAKATNPQETLKYAQSEAAFARTDAGFEPKLAKRYQRLADNIERKLVQPPPALPEAAPIERPAPARVERPIKPEVAEKPPIRGVRRGTKEGLDRVEKAKQDLRDIVNNPDLVGKQRADAIANNRQLVQFLEANADTRKPLELDIHKGDKIAYTGVTGKDGFREFIFLEGANAGEIRVKLGAEARATDVVKRQLEHKEQQVEFARLQPQPPSSVPPAAKQPEPVNAFLGGSSRGAGKIGEARVVSETTIPGRTQKPVPPKEKAVKVKTDAIAVTESQSNFADPAARAELYPLVTESSIKNNRFQPASDAQLANFSQQTPERFGELTPIEKQAVRKQYSIERRKQRNAERLDEFNRKEFNIEPDPALRKRLAEKPPEAPKPEVVRDINRIEKGLKDPDRNLEKALPPEVADELITKRDAAKSTYTEFLIKQVERHSTEIEKGIGIKPGSKMDRAVQQFGEGDLSLERVTKRFGPEQTKKIVDGAAWYRARYEEWLKDYNSMVANLYPGDASKLIRRRKDYFRHFRELGNLSRLLDIVEDPGGHLNAPARILGFIKPATKKLGIIRRRLGRKTDISAAAGYVDYLKEVGYGIHINPMVNYMRQFGRNLDKAYMESNTIPNFRDSFNTWVDRMAGKPDMLEAYMSGYLGRGWDVMNVVTQRAKQNIILANASAVLAQPFNIPQALGQTGSPAFARGMSKTLAQIFTKSDVRGRRSDPMTKSSFIRERYIESSFDKYRFGMVNKARNTAAWVMRTADEISTKMIWNSFYEQARRPGKRGGKSERQAIIHADRMTRKQVAGRGIGELPNLQRTKIFQMVAPFQVEVGNAMWAFIDLFKGQRKFSKVATFMVASYLMNRVAEEIRGNPVSFDPMQALREGIEIAADERRGTAERIAAIPGRLAGEALSNVPLGQTVAILYPKTGGTIPGTDIKLPTRKQVFGSNDPTRFGSTVLVYDALKDWPRKLVLPFGGVQAQKTIKGAKAIQQEKITFGQRELPIEPTMATTVRALIFGPFATKEARAFFEKRDKSITKNTMMDYLLREKAVGHGPLSRRAQRLWNKENPTKKITDEALRKRKREK